VKIRWTVLGLAIASTLALLTTGLAPAVSQGARKAPPPCGVAGAKKADGSTWTCAFYDNFTGRAINRKKWRPVLSARSGFVTGPEASATSAGPACYLDRRDLAWVSKGTLVLAVRKAPKQFDCKVNGKGKTVRAGATGGSLTTMETYTRTYGYYQIRAAFPSTHVAGLQSAIWMFPKDAKLALANYPEMDIAEFFTSVPDRVIPVLHYPMLLPVAQNWTNQSCMVSHPERFHTYWINWSASVISIGVDNKTCLVNNNWIPLPPMVHPEPFNTPFGLILTQALGIHGNAPRANTPFPAFMKVDWVRVWR
jgi:hypothetical protein